MQEKKHEEALAKFSEAQNIFPKNREIVFYKTSAMVLHFICSTENMQLSSKQKATYINAIKAEFDSSIKLFKYDHFLHFYRGLLSLYAKDYDSALSDFDTSIKVNDEPCAQYHLFRGLTYACVSCFKEAMKDLTLAIKLKETLMLAYYNRGKCAYLLGETNMAFMDFQKLILLRPVLI